jgi:hypothetical protein
MKYGGQLGPTPNGPGLGPTYGYSTVNYTTYSVKTFGAAGNGTTNDLGPINLAIAACNANGGILFFPVGNYLVNATPTTITNRACNVLGSGRASTIQAASGTSGIALLKVSNYLNLDVANHNQFIKDITFNCNSSNPTGGTGRQNNGLWLLDALMLYVQNVSLTNCNNTVLMEAANYFEERDVFDKVTVANMTSGFLLQQDAGDVSFNSLQHNMFSDIYFTTFISGDSLFHVTGAASAGFNSFININGNFAAPAAAPQYMFLLDGGSSLFGSFVTGHPETDNGSVSYGFYSNTAAASPGVCTTVNNCLSGSGYIYGLTYTYGNGASPWETNTFSNLSDPLSTIPSVNYSALNGIDNGSFVAGTSGWQSGGLTNAGPAAIAQSTTSPYLHGTSLKITTTTQYYGASTLKNYKVTPGDVIWMSAKLLSDGTFLPWLTLDWLDSTGTSLSLSYLQGSTSTSWTTFATFYTVPANCTNVAFEYFRADTSGGVQSAYLTDLVIFDQTATGIGSVLTAPLSNFITGNVTLGTSSYTPVSGTFPAVTTTAAGTFSVKASVDLQTTSVTAATNFTCELFDGTNVLDQGYWSTGTLGTATVENNHMVLTAIVTESALVTFTARCTSTTASQLMIAAAPNNSGGNFSSGVMTNRLY